MNNIFLGRPSKAIQNFIQNHNANKILHFTALDEGNTKIGLSYISNWETQSNLGDLYLEYSINSGVWVQNWDGSAITLKQNDTLYIRNMAENETVSKTDYDYYQFGMSGGKVAGGGSIQYLLKNDGQRNDVKDYCYQYLFQGCTTLTRAPELPATVLANDCYCCMFSACKSLTKAPELPATTLANDCYYMMFIECQSLVQAPKLPAVVLTVYCYNMMFSGCTSLTQAPELPATTLANACYEYMFFDCSSLIDAPLLPATTLADDCYSYMFRNCVKFSTCHMKASMKGIYKTSMHGNTTKTVIYDL